MKKYKITQLGKIFYGIVGSTILGALFLHKTIILCSLIIMIVVIHIAQFISVRRIKIDKQKKAILEKNYVVKKRINNITVKQIGNTYENINIEEYFQNKKDKMDEEVRKFYKEDYNQIQGVDIFSETIKFFTNLISFKKYKIGDLVIHNEFGVGKVLEFDDYVIIDFFNDNYQQEIQFELNSRKNIPELNLFRVPKDEDSRNYYYNYKKESSVKLKGIIEKISSEFMEVKLLQNIFLENSKMSSLYDFILITDKVYIYELENESKKEIIEEIIDECGLEIEMNQYEDKTYDEILDNIKLNLKTSNNSEIAYELIKNNNIVNFAERQSL